MTRVLTDEEMAERYCLQQCPGGCVDGHGKCLQPPGHLHRHRHGVYDYSGDGSHTWDRQQPNARELEAFLRAADIDSVGAYGKTYLEAGDVARAVIEYLATFQRTASPRRRGWFRRR